MIIPIGTNLFCLIIASHNILESKADPSHPASTYINLISLIQEPKTFFASPPFLVRYLSLSLALGVTAM